MTTSASASVVPQNGDDAFITAEVETLHDFVFLFTEAGFRMRERDQGVRGSHARSRRPPKHQGGNVAREGSLHGWQGEERNRDGDQSEDGPEHSCLAGPGLSGLTIIQTQRMG